MAKEFNSVEWFNKNIRRGALTHMAVIELNGLETHEFKFVMENLVNVMNKKPILYLIDKTDNGKKFTLEWKMKPSSSHRKAYLYTKSIVRDEYVDKHLKYMLDGLVKIIKECYPELGVTNQDELKTEWSVNYFITKPLTYQAKIPAQSYGTIKAKPPSSDFSLGF